MKILCVKQYKCTVFVKFTTSMYQWKFYVLGTSSTCVKAAESTETSHEKGAGELDISNR